MRVSNQAGYDPETNDMIDWFLRHGGETRSIEALDENLALALGKKLNQKQLTLILYHSVKALNQEVYGEDIEKAQKVVKSHIQKWTDNAIKALKGKSEASVSTPQSIENTLSAFRGLNLQPPERLTEFLGQKAETEMQKFSARDLVNVLSASGYLALPLDDKFLQAAGKRLQELGAGLTPNDAIEVFHALATVDSVQQSLKGDERFKLKKTFDALLNNKAVRGKLAGVEDQESMTRRILDSVYWFQGNDLVKKYPKTEDTASLFEQDVRDAFAQSGATMQETTPHPVTGQRIDLTGTFSGKSFYVECDGPTHFLRTSDGHNSVLNGSTIFQTALKTKRDEDMVILRMPHDTFYRNQGNHEVFDDVLLALETLPPGGYIITPAGKTIPLTKGYNEDIGFEDRKPDTLV